MKYTLFFFYLQLIHGLILQRGWDLLMVGQVHSKIDHLTKLKNKTDKPALENNIKNHV